MNWTEEDLAALMARRNAAVASVQTEASFLKARRKTANPGEKRAAKRTLRVSEEDEQSAFLDMCKLHEKKYPDLTLIRSIPNGGYRHKATAAKMKREGQRPGVFDLDLPVPRGIYHGLKLEMKGQGGVISEAQFREYKNCTRQGYYCDVAWGAEEAWKITEWYLKQGGST